MPKHFVLYGGTAVALHYGHRSSVDFDFFTSEPVNPEELMRSLPFLRGGKPVQVGANTLDIEVTRSEVVKISFLGGFRIAGSRSAGDGRPRPAGGIAAGFAGDKIADDMDAQPGEGLPGN